MLQEVLVGITSDLLCKGANLIFECLQCLLNSFDELLGSVGVFGPGSDLGFRHVRHQWWVYDDFWYGFSFLPTKKIVKKMLL